MILINRVLINRVFLDRGAFVPITRALAMAKNTAKPSILVAFGQLVRYASNKFSTPKVLACNVNCGISNDTRT
jgi:hypothetical protein